ncbi:hypothetical protein [uncultured Fibrobacter sp.]|uniref:hypothetical protein n=1 Tax=uncultured Fibrobacter sp. TaxID=261512 RepID=UPI0025D5059D|nr:hypothetical protein [uncultured Fibrobacter sp.]
MNWSIIFAIAIALILLRVLYLRIKANSLESDSFKNMLPKDKLAVLKECLLNNPTRTTLANLDTFLKEQEIEADTESYRPYMERQLQLLRKKNAIAEDNELYAEETAWVDRIRPLEFAEAEKAIAEGDECSFIDRTLEGISRLYSDDAILDELSKLEPRYAKATSLIDGYKKLIALRDESGADDKSLEALRKHRDAWMNDLLTRA